MSERAPNPHADLPDDFVIFDKSEVETTIAARLRNVVSTYPERTAVRSPEGELSYRDLDAASNEVAGTLLEILGPEPAPIALLFTHGIDVVVAQLGVIKAGKFYACIDHTLPFRTLCHLLADLEPKILLCSYELEPLSRRLASKLGSIEVLNPSACRHPPPNLTEVSVSADNIALIVYSSGSTGTPKGVVISHRTVLHFVMNHTNTTHLRSRDRAVQVCPLHGASNIGEVFPTLLNGATLLPFSLKERGMRALLNWMGREKATLCTFVPVVFRLLCESLTDRDNVAHVRLVRLSGDRILRSDIELFKSVFPRSCLLRVALGAAEAMLYAQLIIDDAYSTADEPTPAGYPLEDMEISILDEHRNVLPVLERGEIAVTSRYLSDGYWHNPKLTSERFLQDAKDPKRRTYLTRDIGYLRPEGCLVHVGRNDSSVKIYGRLVSLPDIERALLAMPGIQDAVVVATQVRDQAKATTLIAYFTARDDSESLEESMLRPLLLTRLPTEYVPKRLIRLSKMPVTENNKIDRETLRRNAETIGST